MKDPNILKNIPIFNDLSDKELEGIIDATFSKKVLKDNMILQQDELGDSLFIIVDGKVKVVLYGEDGKEIILTSLASGDFFGEMSLLDGSPRSATVIAAEDSELIILKRSAFTKLIIDNPDISLKMLRELSRRLRVADNKIGSLVLLDAYSRVTRFLVDLAEKHGKVTASGIVIDRMPTHQEIANQLGTSRETVSRILGSLAKSGYIVEGKTLLIPKDSK